MDRGLYISASGMLAELARQDQLANDLANASTPGYKADRASQHSFGELVVAGGSLSLGSGIAELRTDLAPGALRETGEPLDLALDGDGFFAVQTAAGTRYTRNGQFSIDAQGRLVTAAGRPVLGADGRPVEVGRADGVRVAENGTVTAGGRQVGRIAVVTLADVRKEGDSLFAGTPGQPATATAVRQGYLEASGIDAARAMVDMIVSMRAYEAGQRVLRAIDESLGRGIVAGGQVNR
jgi:flagellar basal-body rod protein FlgG